MGMSRSAEAAFSKLREECGRGKTKGWALGPGLDCRASAPQQNVGQAWKFTSTFTTTQGEECWFHPITSTTQSKRLLRLGRSPPQQAERVQDRAETKMTNSSGK